MNFQQKSVFLFALLLFLVSCTPTEDAPIKKTEWLIGTWENNLPATLVYEEWTKSSDVSLSARSYFVAEGDTMVFETIELRQLEDGRLEYIPTLVNQNDGEPVVFTVTSLDDETMVFENPNHDFPQLISYKRLSADSLEANVYGLQNGSERDLYFKMKRID